MSSIDPTGNVVDILNSYNDGLNDFSSFGSGIVESFGKGGEISRGFDILGLAQSSLSLGLDFTPLGSAKSFVEFASGKDYIKGEKVNRGFAAAGIVIGLVGGKGVLNAISKGDDVVDLFRAVSKAELDDIFSVGKFRPHPGGLEAKQFGLNVDEVKNLSASFKDSFAVIKVGVPKSTFRQLDSTFVDTSILKSGSISAQPGKQLDLLNDTFKNIERVH